MRKNGTFWLEVGKAILSTNFRLEVALFKSCQFVIFITSFISITFTLIMGARFPQNDIIVSVNS